MNALQQLLQSASNAAASNVSGPVDLIAAGLRKLGVPVPQNALMSSQWMEEQGLTRKVPQNALSLAGETLGMVAPIAAAAKAPQIAAAMNQAGANLAAPKTLNPQAGAIVWHGSPHKFDKFDSSKIGTGEGAQAYGHGLYLADSTDVAKEYQRRLADVDVRLGETLIDDLIAKGGAVGDAARRLKRDFTNTSVAQSPDDVVSPSFWRETEKFYNTTKTPETEPVSALMRQFGPVSANFRGNLYKVDLPDTAISRMLDFDKPLSQQAMPMDVFGVAQRERLKSMPSSFGSPGVDAATVQGIVADKPGSLAYKMLEDVMGKESAALALRRSGVPGIRFLDEKSRAAGFGTHNYVVFPGEENMLRILERNGQPLR